MTEDLIHKLSEFSVATLHMASTQSHVLPINIRAIAPGMKLCGLSFVVQLKSGDNLALHHAIYQATEGSILIAAVEGTGDFGYWGEIMTHAALQRNIKGLIIDGCVRDSEYIQNLNFPVFATGLCIRSTSKNYQYRKCESIRIGDVDIHHNDVIVGDRDGAIIVSSKFTGETVARARLLEEEEDGIISSLKKGRTTLELYKL